VYTTGRSWIHVLPFYTYISMCVKGFTIHFILQDRRIRMELRSQRSSFQFSQVIIHKHLLFDKWNGNWPKSNFQCVCVLKCWFKMMINGCTSSSTICKVPNYKYGSIIKVGLALPTCSSTNVEWKETVRPSLHCIDLHLKGWPSIAGCLYDILYIRHFISFDLF